MIIEAGNAGEARELAKKLLGAARYPGDVRTVHRGSRIAFDVPDDLGRAVGREPDTQAPAEAPAETPVAEPVTEAAPAGEPGDVGHPLARPAEPEPVDPEPAQDEAEPKKRRRVH